MGVTMQFYATFAASFGFLIMGSYYTFPSYTIELYKSANTTLLSSPITELEISLLGSLPPLGSIVGAAVVGPVIDKIGRQKGGILQSLPSTLGWVLIYLTNSSTVILIARFIMGISGGAFVVYAPILISEVALDSIRGRLGSVPVCNLSFGCLLSYIFGWFLSYHTIIWINIISGVVHIILSCLLVESPIYLVRQGRYNDARDAISKYKGGTFVSVSEELSRLKAQITPAVKLLYKKDCNEKTIEETKEEKLHPDESLYMRNRQEETKLSIFKYLYTSPPSRHALIVVGTHVILQGLMSAMSISVYAKLIFMEAAPSLSGHFCSVLYACMMFGGVFVSLMISDRVGRRVLLISSSILVALSMGILGILLQSRSAPSWISVVIMLVYCFFFNLGTGSVPFLLLAESFIPKVQGLASMIIVECMYFAIFLNISIIPVTNRLIGLHGTFYGFAAVATVNAVIGFLCVPETKGLSSEKIQAAYARRSRQEF